MCVAREVISQRFLYRLHDVNWRAKTKCLWIANVQISHLPTTTFQHFSRCDNVSNCVMVICYPMGRLNHEVSLVSFSCWVDLETYLFSTASLRNLCVRSSAFRVVSCDFVDRIFSVDKRRSTNQHETSRNKTERHSRPNSSDHYGKAQPFLTTKGEAVPSKP